MNSLKVFKVILFILAFIATIQIILLAKFEGLNESIESMVIQPLRKSTQSYALAQIVEPKVTEETEIQPRINCRLDDETQQMIVEKCEEYELDFVFVMALIFKESSFHSDADNGISVGLMQINRFNHEWLSEELGISDFFDPEQNVTAGLYILNDLFEKYEDPSKVLMAYNMGETGAKKLWKQGIYSSAYSEGVLQLANKYNEEIHERMD